MIEKMFELYMRTKEYIAHIVFDLRIAKETAIQYCDNKPVDVYIVWGRW